MGDDFDKIDDLDLSQISDIIKSLHIPTKGLKCFDEVKAKLRDYLEETATRSVREPPHQVIYNASKSDERKRRSLQDLYKRTAEFLDKLDSDVKNSLQETFGDLKTILKESITNLQPRNQYTVLVAGETSAGKSSVINLILGEDLLPSALLCTTSTICELKYGDKPMICVHFKDDGTQTRDPETHELIKSPEESYKAQIDKFANVRNDRDKTPYSKIELFWPHPLLKENVMIVDSPGVGESEVMDEFVVSYLPNAFCFMYVVNSVNAGGVQKDRLEMLLRYAQAKLTKNDLALFTGCALFVCNKWDQIDLNEQEKVKEAQIEKLSKTLLSLDPKTQMVYLSCTTAKTCQKYGYITRDFNNLITGISNLLVSAMQNKLEMHYRWLEDVLFHASRRVKISLKSTKLSHQETEKNISRVKRRMQELQESQQRKFDELSEYQSQILKDIIAKLAEYFKSGDTVKQFCQWSPSEAPGVKATWQATKDEVLKCISRRTQQFVQSWEDEKHEFANAQVSLAKFCCKKYDIMEEEIRQMEEYVFLDADDADVAQDEDATETQTRAKSRKGTKGATPMWVRQGLAQVVVGSPISTLGLFKTVKKTFHYKGKRERYQEDPSAYMSKRSQKCLAIIGNQDRLLPFINEQLEDAVQCLKQIKEKMPKLLEGDNKLYQKLLDDNRSKTEIREIYEPLSKQAEFLTRELIVFSLREMRKSDFTRDELKWDEHRQSIIGRGSFSTVYKGVLTQRGKQEVKVAIKEYIDPLTTVNVWHFADEEKALRELQHPGIVKYFGTCLLHETNGTTIMIILELCDCSLRKLVTSHPENSPSRVSNEPVRNKVLSWTLQVLDALRYIHSKAFVHRDLKLDNLLLTHDGKVKVADVGVGKYEEEITGTVCGTSLYLAPEVLEGRIYNSRADMYSFGFVLWELWYGERAFGDMEVIKQQSKLLEDIRRGLRPSHIEETTKPFPAWEEVMVSCWEKNPRERMTAGNALAVLKLLENKEDDHSLINSGPPTPQKRTVPPQSRPRNSSQKPLTKPKPAPRPSMKSTGASVSYSSKAQNSSLHFDSKE